MQQWRIGRAPGCEVVLEHPNVSRHHATIRQTADGLLIVDAGSARGTKVNGRPVGTQGVPLRQGDVVNLGGHEVPTGHGPLLRLFEASHARSPQPGPGVGDPSVYRDPSGRPQRLPVPGGGGGSPQVPGPVNPHHKPRNMPPLPVVGAIAAGLLIIAGGAAWMGLGGASSAPGGTAGDWSATAKESIFMIAARTADGKVVGFGSGFVTDRKPVVVTNAHVAKVVETCLEHDDCTPLAIAHGRASEPFEVLSVRFHRLADDPQEGPFAHKGAILVADVAVLEVDAPKHLPPGLTLADPADLNEDLSGRDVYVVGFPGDTMKPSMPVATLSRGMVGRVWPEGTANFIQHEANITPGCSGSPLLMDGPLVIGINYAGVSIQPIRVFDPSTGGSTVKRINPASGLNLAAGVKYIHDML